MAPEDVVQRQLDAFNERDLDAFLPLFPDDVVILDLRSGREILRGMGAFRERYASYFAANPGVHVELAGRIVLDRIVVDHERIRIAPGSSLEEALAIYEVDGEVIPRMWFVEPGSAD